MDILAIINDFELDDLEMQELYDYLEDNATYEIEIPKKENE